MPGTISDKKRDASYFRQRAQIINVFCIVSSFKTLWWFEMLADVTNAWLFVMRLVKNPWNGTVCILYLIESPYLLTSKMITRPSQYIKHSVTVQICWMWSSQWEIIHIIFKCLTFLYSQKPRAVNTPVQEITVISARPDHTVYAATTVNNNILSRVSFDICTRDRL